MPSQSRPSKYLIPSRPPDLLRRPRLLNFLHEHIHRKLVLIAAAAGYGKSSLLADFLNDVDFRVAWCLLDESDADLAALGGQVYACPQCDQVQYRYHSCRNRHCPKCQHAQAQAWLEHQQTFLLPVPDFLLTFTLPAELRKLARPRQRLFYDLLFRASAAATQQLARAPRFLGGQVGMVGVLHTWRRDLGYHPHVHYLVPAGGLAADGQTLRQAQSLP